MASLSQASRRAHFRKISGNLRAASERASRSSAKRQTAPAFPILPLFQFPTLLRRPAFQRAAVLPADPVLVSRNFPSSPARGNAAAESARASWKKDTPAIHWHNKTSRQMHRRSERRRARREYPQTASPAAQKVSTRDQSSAAQDRKKLHSRVRASLSTNRGSLAGSDRTFLQTGSLVPTRRRKSFLRASKNRRRAAVPDK